MDWTPVQWRRLDLPGHDAARLETECSRGGAVRHGGVSRGAPTVLEYVIDAGSDWMTAQAHVRGWRGREAIDLRLHRDPGGGWTLNGMPRPAVQGCIRSRSQLHAGHQPAAAPPSGARRGSVRRGAVRVAGMARGPAHSAGAAVPSPERGRVRLRVRPSRRGAIPRCASGASRWLGAELCRVMGGGELNERADPVTRSARFPSAALPGSAMRAAAPARRTTLPPW